ncbi:hypothetical protein PMIN07_012608 [Paraphaeosphaeria minitans]
MAPKPQKAEGWDGRTAWRSHSGRKHGPAGRVHDSVGGEGIDWGCPADLIYYASPPNRMAMAQAIGMYDSRSISAIETREREMLSQHDCATCRPEGARCWVHPVQRSFARPSATEERKGKWSPSYA